MACCVWCVTSSISVAFSVSMPRGRSFRLDSIRRLLWLLSSSTPCRSCSLLFTWPFIWTKFPLLQKPWSLIWTKFRYLRNRLLTTEIAEKALERLATINGPFSADVIEGTDLLAILMGRMLQVVEGEEMGEAIEHETRQIAEVARNTLQVTDVDGEVKEAALDVIRYLPVRSASEIALVLRLAEDAVGEELQGACVLALAVAKPKDGDAWTVLEKGKRSTVGEVREVVERVLGSRGR